MSTMNSGVADGRIQSSADLCEGMSAGQRSMYMDRAHPRFDITMELLASVPVEPAFATLSDLKDDLQLKSLEVAVTLIRDLRRCGFGVKVEAPVAGSGRSRVASLSRERQGRAVGAAKDYLRNVYGGES